MYHIIFNYVFSYSIGFEISLENNNQLKTSVVDKDERKNYKKLVG